MKNKIAILTFARFPSEMAYGIHLVQIAGRKITSSLAYQRLARQEE